ncbi:hypothetical protein HRbin20_01042 [bacterium HR20]|nr:hypothetical protein HRbin20_01042 [bacterium HR20]
MLGHTEYDTFSFNLGYNKQCLTAQWLACEYADRYAIATTTHGR